MPRLYNRNKYLERRSYLRRNATNAERILWEQFRDRRFWGLRFRRQHGIGLYIVDFYCKEKRLVVEVDGDSHSTLHQREYDRVRTAWLNSMCLRVIRFANDEVEENLERVLIMLKREVTTPNPSSREEG